MAPPGTSGYYGRMRSTPSDSRWRAFPQAARLGLPVLICLAGCAGDPVQRVDEPAPGEDLPILWEGTGTFSRLSRPVRIVAYDRATLAQVSLAEIPVDFTRQMVLIAGMGPTFSSELGVRIARVWREGPRLRVQERRIHPGVDKPPTLERASPWCAVVVPRSELPIEGYSSRLPGGLLEP